MGWVTFLAWQRLARKRHRAREITHQNAKRVEQHNAAKQARSK